MQADDANESSLDPLDWNELRELGHSMIDEMMDHLRTISAEPVWKKPPAEIKSGMLTALPEKSTQFSKVYSDFKKNILPYNNNNIHPRFWAWVQGGGTPAGMLADLLASGMNSNVSIGEHMPMYVETQVIEWCKEMLGYASSASGILTSGASIANITALIVARNNFNKGIRTKGLLGNGQMLTIYGSAETHNCLVKGIEIIGLGSEQYRRIPVKSDFTIDTGVLRQTIKNDLEAGFSPFCIIGNLGTVNTGAVDPLNELSEIAVEYSLWFHIDGAIGAVLKLLPEFSASTAGIEGADSISLDFHKWMYMNYEVGCVLIKNSDIHREAFTSPASYLMQHERGLSAGPEPFSNLGMELSRGFKALKVWMSMKHYGMETYRKMIRQNLAQVQFLVQLINEEPLLERMAGSFNILCFRYNPGNAGTEKLNALNKEILMRLQEEGIASPSYTLINGNYCIRVAHTNHRTRKSDFKMLVEQVMRLGRELKV